MVCLGCHQWRCSFTFITGYGVPRVLTYNSLHQMNPSYVTEMYMCWIISNNEIERNWLICKFNVTYPNFRTYDSLFISKWYVTWVLQWNYKITDSCQLKRLWWPDVNTCKGYNLPDPPHLISSWWCIWCWRLTSSAADLASGTRSYDPVYQDVGGLGPRYRVCWSPWSPGGEGEHKLYRRYWWQ